jgi:hypothetical protein
VEEGEWCRGTRRGAGSDGTERVHQRTSTWRSKRERMRSGDDRSTKVGEVTEEGELVAVVPSSGV